MVKLQHILNDIETIKYYSLFYELCLHSPSCNSILVDLFHLQLRTPMKPRGSGVERLTSQDFLAIGIE